jgi:putative membrane protein
MPYPMVAALPVQPMLHVGARIELTSFTVHWSTVIGLALLAALYEWRAAVARRAPEPARPTTAQRVLLYVGLFTIFFALNGWLHDLSDYYLFSAHMVQHLLLTFVACPLLVMATPGWMLRPSLQYRAVNAIARWITRPAVCFAIFNVVLAAWHLPVMYNAALAHHEIHIAQHILFMVAAVLMWWPVLSPMQELPRLSYPMQMLYLFLMTIPMAIVAVYIVYAEQVLYPAYSWAPRVWQITPRTDQMIGGLIMWLPGGLFFFTIISVLFFRWQALGEDSKDAAQVGWQRAPGARTA